MIGNEGRSSISKGFDGVAQGRNEGSSPSASKLKALWDQVTRGDYFLPRVICLDGPNVWPLTPLAICWISPPDLRNAAIWLLIDSLVSTAGAGFALLVDAFTRMAAINL